MSRSLDLGLILVAIILFWMVVYVALHMSMALLGLGLRGLGRVLRWPR